MSYIGRHYLVEEPQEPLVYRIPAWLPAVAFLVLFASAILIGSVVA